MKAAIHARASRDRPGGPAPSPPTVALYARVSKGEGQDPETQLLQLRDWATQSGIEAVEYVDRASTRDTRPQKEEVLRLARLGLVDTIVVAGLDRWGRTLSELVLELDEFEKRDIRLVSLREGFSLDNAMGRAFANLLAVFADLERRFIRERTLQGLIRAVARGKIRGRHPADCGCGWRSESGDRRHDGKVKPVRDGNRIVAWNYPNGPTKPVRWSRPNKPPTEGDRSATGGGGF